MNRNISIAIGAIAVALAWSGAVAAKGALAIGEPADIAQRGVAVGYSFNFESQDAANTAALQKCLTQPDAPPDTQALCKVVRVFSKKCVVISLDPQAGTPGFGWAIAKTEKAAASKSMAMCHKTAGADRRKYCVISKSACDVGDKTP
jgi:hypothetical protein